MIEGLKNLQGLSKTEVESSHEHYWVQVCAVEGARFLQCSCGLRKKITKSFDGSEHEEIVTRPGGSLRNLLPLTAAGSIIPVEEVLRNA